jgi:hypothetical protein
VLTERTLRTWLWRNLGMTKARFRVLCDDLEKEGLVEYVLNGDESKEFLLAEARRRLRFSERMNAADRRRGRRKTSYTNKGPDLSAYEQASARALETHLALLAEQDWDVREIRRRLLGGKTLSAKMATRLIKSPAARVMRCQDFEKHQIPITGHTATVEVVPSLTQLENEEDQWLRIHFVVGRKRKSIAYRRQAHYRSPETVKLAIPLNNRSGPPACAWWPIWRDSVLDQVKTVATALVRRYHFRPHEATWFILTGLPPVLRPLRSEVRSLGAWRLIGPSDYDLDQLTYVKEELTLRIAPWISDAAVLSALKRFRTQALGKRDLRRPHLRTIKVLEFVDTSLRESGDKPDWGQMLRSWNRAMSSRPSWRYRSTSNFRTAYERAKTFMVLLSPVNQRRK